MIDIVGCIVVGIYLVIIVIVDLYEGIDVEGGVFDCYYLIEVDVCVVVV